MLITLHTVQNDFIGERSRFPLASHSNTPTLDSNKLTTIGLRTNLGLMPPLCSDGAQGQYKSRPNSYEEISTSTDGASAARPLCLPLRAWVILFGH
jgi:hypothetical protein